MNIIKHMNSNTIKYQIKLFINNKTSITQFIIFLEKNSLRNEYNKTNEKQHLPLQKSNWSDQKEISLDLMTD